MRQAVRCRAKSKAAGDKGLTAHLLGRRAGLTKVRQRDFDEATKYLTDRGLWRVEPTNRGALVHAVARDHTFLVVRFACVSCV